MRRLQELPTPELQNIHDVLSGMLISVAGVAQYAEIAFMVGKLLGGHRSDIKFVQATSEVTYRLVEVLINYKQTAEFVRREVEVVLYRSDPLPFTVIKSVSAYRTRDLPNSLDLYNTYTM